MSNHFNRENIEKIIKHRDTILEEEDLKSHLKCKKYIEYLQSLSNPLLITFGLIVATEIEDWRTQLLDFEAIKNLIKLEILKKDLDFDKTALITSLRTTNINDLIINLSNALSDSKFSLNNWIHDKRTMKGFQIVIENSEEAKEYLYLLSSWGIVDAEDYWEENLSKGCISCRLTDLGTEVYLHKHKIRPRSLITNPDDTNPNILIEINSIHANGDNININNMYKSDNSTSTITRGFSAFKLK